MYSLEEASVRPAGGAQDIESAGVRLHDFDKNRAVLHAEGETVAHCLEVLEDTAPTSSQQLLARQPRVHRAGPSPADGTDLRDRAANGASDARRRAWCTADGREFVTDARTIAARSERLRRLLRRHPSSSPVCGGRSVRAPGPVSREGGR